MIIDQIPIPDEVVYRTIISPAERSCPKPVAADFYMVELKGGRYEIIVRLICQDTENGVKYIM